MANKKKEVDVWQTLMAQIPKEHKKTMNALIRLALEHGRQQVLELVQDLGNVPAKDVDSYGIYRDSDLDGG